MHASSGIQAETPPEMEAPAAPKARWRWARGLLAGRVIAGLGIILFFTLLAIFGPQFLHTDPGATSAAQLDPPSAAHWLGTTSTGQDVFAQVVYGARVSMEVGFAAGVLTTLWAIIVGVIGGYATGATSGAMSMLSNVFLVLPALPLAVIIASYLPNSGSAGVVLVITVTGWAWGARVLRAQTLSLRRRDFVEAARATGESSLKIALYDILPNELPIIAATFLGAVVAAILTQASLAFLGLSSVTQWSWGTMLYWAQNGEAVIDRAWWWFVPPGLCIALVGTALALINFGLDEFINPRLRQVVRDKKKRPRTWPAWLADRKTAGREQKVAGPLASSDAGQRQVVLEAKGLTVEYRSGEKSVKAATDVSFVLHRGEVLGLAGESGSGKSTTARAVTRLLRPPAEVVAGELLYTRSSGEVVDVLELSDRDLRRFRWEEIAIVFQSAMHALNPVLRLGVQIDDVLRAHRPSMRSAERRARIAELLELVGIPPARASAYPHELSGGMRQRAMIAMGLALEPEVIVMDEPTTALDVVIQRQIIELIMSLTARLGFSVIFITHDLSLLLELCDTIAIMYAGRVVELAPTDQFRAKPGHPYSQGLLESFPRLEGPRKPLVGIPGSPPDMQNLPTGCVFEARCPVALEACVTHVPPLMPARPSGPAARQLACHLYPHGGEANENLAVTQSEGWSRK